MNHAALMLELFQGRNDAYGGDEGRAVYGNVDERLIGLHLQGVVPMGTYCVKHLLDMDAWMALETDAERMEAMVVKWGCCDIDTGTWQEAYMLSRVLEGMGLKPWVERSRSKGWHVWVFSDEWVPAYVMRRCLKMAYKAIDLQAKEANPKSELLRPNQLGNYVRTPYKGAITGGKDGTTAIVERQTFMDYGRSDDGDPISIDDFLLLHELGLVVSTAERIRHWASKWYEPPRRITLNEGVILEDSELGQLVQRLPRPLRTLFDNGPKSGDTSQGLMALGWNAAKAGWTPQDVYAIVAAADHRWGKYAATRTDPDAYYTDIVARAFG